MQIFSYDPTMITHDHILPLTRQQAAEATPPPYTSTSDHSETSSLLSAHCLPTYGSESPGSLAHGLHKPRSGPPLPLPRQQGPSSEPPTFPYAKPYTVSTFGYNEVPLSEDGVKRIQLAIDKSCLDAPVTGATMGFALGIGVGPLLELALTGMMGGDDPFGDCRFCIGLMAGMVIGTLVGGTVGQNLTTLQPRNASTIHPYGLYFTGIVDSTEQSRRIADILSHPDNTALRPGPELPTYLVMTEPGSVSSILASRNQRLNLSLTPGQIRDIESYYLHYQKISHQVRLGYLREA